MSVHISNSIYERMISPELPVLWVPCPAACNSAEITSCCQSFHSFCPETFACVCMLLVFYGRTAQSLAKIYIQQANRWGKRIVFHSKQPTLRRTRLRGALAECVPYRGKNVRWDHISVTFLACKCTYLHILRYNWIIMNLKKAIK